MIATAHNTELCLSTKHQESSRARGPFRQLSLSEYLCHELLRSLILLATATMIASSVKAPLPAEAT